MRLIIVRHGETAWNTGEKRFRGQLDVELSSYGFKQAIAVGQVLVEEAIDVIYFSPMARVRQTAEGLFRELLKKNGVHFQEEPLLMDIHYGDWQGKTHQEVFSANPAVEHFWTSQPEELLFPNGESWYTVYDRIDRLFKRLRSEDHQCVVLVSHRVVINIILLYLLGLDPSHFWDFMFDTCSISEIRLENDGSFEILYLNDTHHIPPKD